MLAHLLLILMHLKQSFEKAERLVARRSIYAIRISFRLMGRDTAYWYRRSHRVLVREGRVSFWDIVSRRQSGWSRGVLSTQ